MSIITENGIDTLNYVTKDLDNLDDLGIYLAKETDINALKILKFIILVGRCNYLKKDFNINKDLILKGFLYLFHNNIKCQCISVTCRISSVQSITCATG